MKYFYLVIFLAVVLVSCKKDEATNLSEANDASFSVFKTTFYMDQNITFVANNTNSGDSNYSWNFGNGETVKGKTVVDYSFAKAGTYKVSMTVGGKTTSKNIRILPGNASIIVKNGTTVDITSLECYTNLTSQAVRENILTDVKIVGGSSDTLYVKFPFKQSAMIEIAGVVKGKLPFRLNTRNWLIPFQNTVFTIEALTPTIYRNKNGSENVTTFGSWTSSYNTY